MRILDVDATATIGRAVVAALSAGNEIVAVSRQSTAVTVDLADPGSVRRTVWSARSCAPPDRQSLRRSRS